MFNFAVQDVEQTITTAINGAKGITQKQQRSVKSSD